MTGKKQTFRVFIDRADAQNYCSLVRCSPKLIILEFQVSEGTQPQPQVHLEKQPEIEYSAKELQLNSDRLRCKQ
ncbi:MAG: hypothetical protein ACQCN3_02650 [Candidatus Bathyarchaeia archaeon]|jgi:hypothetical protein